MSRRTAEPQRAIGWIGADALAALPGLARKLPHYGKYSYLAFAGSEPTNVVKGQWSAVGSPLVRTSDDAQAGERAQLPPREPLASLEPVFDPARLMAHVERLASPEWQGRGVGSQTAWTKLPSTSPINSVRRDLNPGDGTGASSSPGRKPTVRQGAEVTLRNVIGVLPGRDPARAQESVVIGAHYDHLGLGWPDARQGSEGKIHPGADDNASGVAVLLEVAALLGGQAQPERSLVFVAFSGEEWGLKGSRHYVQTAERWPLDKCLAMVNLDTVGNLRGAKLLVLGSGSASEWKHIAMGVGFTTGVESVCVADDFGSSDQRAFLDAGVPAVQLFTGPTEHYHRPSDTPEQRGRGRPGRGRHLPARKRGVPGRPARALELQFAAGRRRTGAGGFRRTTGQPRNHAGFRIRRAGREGRFGPGGQPGLSGGPAEWGPLVGARRSRTGGPARLLGGSESPCSGGHRHAARAA